MRSRSRSDLDAVAAQFESWRAGRTKRAIPSELWAAAVGLVGRYGTSAICGRLRLNASRFKEMRETLGTASWPVIRAVPVESRRVGGAAGDRPGAFIELPALRVAPIPAVVSAPGVGRADGACTLVLEGVSGARLTIVLRQAAPEIVDTVCRLVLPGAVSRSERGRP